MPNRVIKESIWTSPNLNRLSALAERHFYRILLLPDDFGCCELTPAVVKGKCYPLQPKVTIKDMESWQRELEEEKLIIQWSQNGREYGIFVSFSRHQRIRATHHRRTPEPPKEVMEQVEAILADAGEPYIESGVIDMSVFETGDYPSKLKYIAVFFDGEGCLSISKRLTQKASRGYVLTPSGIISNTNSDILDRIQETLGYGNIVEKWSNNENAKTVYQLQFTANELRKILPSLVEYLHVKKESAITLLGFLNSTDDNERLIFYEKLREMNSRGVNCRQVSSDVAYSGYNPNPIPNHNPSKGDKSPSPFTEDIKTIFTGLKTRRGYDPPAAAAEAKSAKWMLSKGYSVDQILSCCDYLKADPWWQDKPLHLMSVQKKIGEWVAQGQPVAKGAYGTVRRYTTPEELAAERGVGEVDPEDG